MKIKEVFAKIVKFINDLFTDSADRPELKGIFGVICFVISVILAFTQAEFQVVCLFFGGFLALLFGMTMENVKIDQIYKKNDDK